MGAVGMAGQNHEKAATAFPCSHQGKLCPQVRGHPEWGTRPATATGPGSAGKRPLVQRPGLAYTHSREDSRRRRSAEASPSSTAMHVCRRASREAVYRTWPAERKFNTKLLRSAGRKAPTAPAAGPSLWSPEAPPGPLEHPTHPTFVFLSRVQGQPSTHQTEGARCTQ